MKRACRKYVRRSLFTRSGCHLRRGEHWAKYSVLWGKASKSGQFLCQMVCEIFKCWYCVLHLLTSVKSTGNVEPLGNTKKAIQKGGQFM